MGQDNAVKHSKLNCRLYILKVIAFLLFFGVHIEATDPARKLCLNTQFTVGHADGSTTCEDCGVCQAGQQHSHVCGEHVSANARLVCEVCPQNTFSSHEGTSRCAPCSSCAEDQVVLQSCTATQDVVCDKKCSSHDRYFDENGICLPCSKCCGDGRDKVENECKSKLGATSENVCSFNHSGNLCDKSTTPTAATSSSTEITRNATSALNVTGTPTQTSASGGSFASTSVSGRSSSGRIVVIVLFVLLPIIFVTVCVTARQKCNRLHRGNTSDVEAGQSETGEDICGTEMRSTATTAVAKTVGAFGSRKDIAWEEDEEERKGSNEPLLTKLEPVQRTCAEERLNKANKETVVAEKGLTSGLFDEASDQEEYDVEEGEEREEEEEGEEEDQQQEHAKPTHDTYCSCQEEKTKKVSKPLKDLVNGSSDHLDEICKRLDARITGVGNYEKVAKYYKFDMYTILDFEKPPGGPSKALISAIIAKYPQVTVEMFAGVVAKKASREDVAQLLRAFDSE